MSWTARSLLSLLVLFTGQAQEAPRPRAYWQAIVDSGYAVPEGECAYDLLVELSGLLGSRDPELRDGFGYGIPAAWILRGRELDRFELLALVELWTANLERGLGNAGDDSVLTRSFSALDLSLVAALDDAAPFMEKEEFDSLLGAALVYLEGERDLRGWEEGVGWIHSAAHTADLLKFLARSRHLGRTDAFAILAGIARRLHDTDGYVFVHEEDERLAAVVLSLLSRDDADPEELDEFLAELVRGSRSSSSDFDPVAFAAAQNSKNFLRVLFVQLARAKPSPGLGRLRTNVLEALDSL